MNNALTVFNHSKNNPCQATALPACFQNFNVSEMNTFYAVKQYVHNIDVSPILDKCIYKIDKRHISDGTCSFKGNSHQLVPFLGPIRTEVWEQNYTEEITVYVSTAMLMEKLDQSLYLWRELNPELVSLLQSHPLQEISVIANWVKMVNYMAPLSSERVSHE